MKKKKMFSVLFLMVCMIFAMSATAFAYKNQWVTQPNGYTYYYGSNQKAYTGGPKKISRNGKQALYLFDSKGRLIKNKLIKRRDKFYLSRSDGTLLTSFGTWNGKTYYGTASGHLKTGLQKYKNKYYYFDKANASALKRAWKKIGKYYYYFNGAGRAYHGAMYTINGNRYYFDKNAHRFHGVQKIKNDYYGFHVKTGKMVYGWKTWNKKRYYFNKNRGGRAYKDGFYEIDGSRYYFDATAARQTGWKIIGNKRYYLDPNKNGAQVFGKRTINGTTYNFGTKGYVVYRPSGKLTVRVNRAKNVVTVFDGNTPIKAMTCSVGVNNSTPVGTFTLYSHYRWWYLYGPSIGQYCCHFASEYLFHSVPMKGYSKDPYNLRADDFNKLGTAASEGCVRLSVADAKWIYDNVPSGSKVVISDHEPTPLGKPATLKMRPGTIGKDPTDIWS
ncbi:MAG: L,D-transpeptidase family protein [Marvinbryantia sp.]